MSPRRDEWPAKASYSSLGREMQAVLARFARQDGGAADAVEDIADVGARIG